MSRVQPATFNEAWSDDRVFAYLNHPPSPSESADFFVLYNAYKHMRAHDFDRLLKEFTKRGGDVNATNKDGERVHDVIARYPAHSADFLALLASY